MQQIEQETLPTLQQAIQQATNNASNLQSIEDKSIDLMQSSGRMANEASILANEEILPYQPQQQKKLNPSQQAQFEQNIRDGKVDLNSPVSIDQTLSNVPELFDPIDAIRNTTNEPVLDKQKLLQQQESLRKQTGRNVSITPNRDTILSELNTKNPKAGQFLQDMLGNRKYVVGRDIQALQNNAKTNGFDFNVQDYPSILHENTLLGSNAFDTPFKSLQKTLGGRYTYPRQIIDSLPKFAQKGINIVGKPIQRMSRGYHDFFKQIGSANQQLENTALLNPDSPELSGYSPWELEDTAQPAQQRLDANKQMVQNTYGDNIPEVIQQQLQKPQPQESDALSDQSFYSVEEPTSETSFKSFENPPSDRSIEIGSNIDELADAESFNLVNRPQPVQTPREFNPYTTNLALPEAPNILKSAGALGDAAFAVDIAKNATTLASNAKNQIQDKGWLEGGLEALKNTGAGVLDYTGKVMQSMFDNSLYNPETGKIENHQSNLTDGWLGDSPLNRPSTSDGSTWGNISSYFSDFYKDASNLFGSGSSLTGATNLPVQSSNVAPTATTPTPVPQPQEEPEQKQGNAMTGDVGSLPNVGKVTKDIMTEQAQPEQPVQKAIKKTSRYQLID